MKVKVSRKLDSLNSLVSQLKKSSDEIGAIAIFIGVVRGTHGEEKVLRLEYEAHKALALKVLKKIVRDLKSRHEIIDVVVEHRIGTVQVGEEVMYVLIASKHREEGFRALTETVERVKHEVPIWKKEVTENGAHWVENL
jgi:molybdopterin synthase catalytic subunit